MKKLLCFCCGLLVATVGVRATPLFSDNFTYPNGNLVGQGPWLQNGASAVNPVQVTGNTAYLQNNGQDVNAALSSPYSLVDGTSFYIGATIDVTAANVTGDYFLHWSPATGSTIFISRVEIRSSGAGYQMGYVETSGTGASLTWGTEVLNFNQNYRMVLAYNVVAGTVNDTADLYVGSGFTDLLVQGNNTPYLSDAWNSVTGEQSSVGAINLRQGTTANAPTLSVDDLGMATTFAEAATFTPVTVPEPTTLSLLGGFGLLALLISRRRK
jgi:trimeric autotransporter adhesin